MLKLMPLGDFFEEQYKFADVFNELKLSDTETGLLSAIMLLNPGMNVNTFENNSISEDIFINAVHLIILFIASQRLQKILHLNRL